MEPAQAGFSLTTTITKTMINAIEINEAPESVRA